PRSVLRGPPAAAVQGELAERDPPALRDQGPARRPAARHVRPGRSAGDLDPPPAHRPHRPCQDAGWRLALPAGGREVLTYVARVGEAHPRRDGRECQMRRVCGPPPPPPAPAPAARARPGATPPRW